MEKTLQIELTDRKRQYIINAIDAYVRQTGISNAVLGIEIVNDLQSSENSDDERPRKDVAR